MNDDELIARIHALVEEEHRLEQSASAGHPLGDDGRERLTALEVQLDQCWDLLRQRRARRSAGLDPDQTTVRPADVVERYQQ